MWNEFEDIPDVFVERYVEWFVIWAKNHRRWGNVCYFPLVPLPGKPVLADIDELDEYGNVPMIIVGLMVEKQGTRLRIKPLTFVDRDRIQRHCKTLR
jgi:hypothetical protein